MVVRMRSTRSHTGNRRSHHALIEPRLLVCKGCNQMRLMHRACTECGTYKGIQVIDVAAERAREDKRIKEKNKALGIEAKREALKE